MHAWQWGTLAFGIVALVLGVVTRMGVNRAAFMWWNVESADSWIKNRPFILIPGGLAFALIPISVELHDAGVHPWFELTMLLALISLVIGLWWVLRRSPEWMKPAWLQAMERGEAVHPDRFGLVSTKKVGRLPIWAPLYWGILGAIAVLCVLTAIFGWPSSLWIGLGMGMVQLAAMRPTSRDQANRFYAERRQHREEDPPQSGEAA